MNSSPAPPRLALLACDVLKDEIALHGGSLRIQHIRYFEIGLHDQPDKLRDTLQQAITELDGIGEIDAVVLAYGLCGRGTHALRAGRHPLVIPRAHDCITVFFGSRERFATQQAAEPDSYYFTPGWMRAGRTPGTAKLEMMRRELSERFDPDDVEYLLEIEKQKWAQHGRAIYTDLGTAEAGEKAGEAEDAARELGWEFRRETGDPQLLRDLLAGRWDSSRFQIVAPGEILTHRPDDAIFCVRKEGCCR